MRWFPGWIVMAIMAPCQLQAAPLFEQTDVFVGGDNDICEYRIPALITTNAGTLLAVCDARVSKPGDAPNNIDQVLRRSIDGGRTWTPLQTIVDCPGTEAAADPSLLVDRITGRIWLFYAHAPEGIGSGQSQPGLSGPTFGYHVVTSDDDGLIWSRPQDLTPMVKDPAWNAFWPGPGRGTQTRGGRLLVPSTCSHKAVCSSHLVYSDDHGKTWHTTTAAGTNTNESQVVELADGSLMMNMRSNRGKNRRAVATTRDGGKTWSPLVDDPTLIEPVCQASFIRYTAQRDGYRKNRLLFSNPAKPNEGYRANMTVRLSYDEGKTWPVAKTIYPGPASYSCLTVLPDGTVGLLFECGKKSCVEKITFARFNLEWLTNGQDHLERSPK